MKDPNFIIKLLATFGVLEIKEIEKEKPKQKFVSDRDPITAPLREQRSNISYISSNLVIVIGVVVFLIMLVLWAFQLNSNIINENHSENTVIPESVNPDPQGSEREIRAFWQ